MADRREISYDIRDHIGTISSRGHGWDKQLNLIAWNGQEPPKFDIRAWSSDQKHMSRGITLYEEEMREIVRLYQGWKNRKVVEEARQRERKSWEDAKAYRHYDRDETDGGRPTSAASGADAAGGSVSAAWSGTDHVTLQTECNAMDAAAAHMAGPAASEEEEYVKVEDGMDAEEQQDACSGNVDDFDQDENGASAVAEGDDDVAYAEVDEDTPF